MRPWSAILALALAGCGGGRADIPRAGKAPAHVMSINLCTDQLVLALLPPERIASVTWLSRDPNASIMAAAARRVAVNHGQAEEVVRQRPDLVVAGASSTPTTRALLTRLGYPMIEVEEADSVDKIRAVTRQVARAVGEVARGERLIARMDRQLALLAARPGPPIRVAAWSGGGLGAAAGTFYDQLLGAAGAVNVADRPFAGGSDRPDVETLLRAAPAVLITDAAGTDGPGLRDDVQRHPLVRRFWDATRRLHFPPAEYDCATPFMGDAAMRLRAGLRRMDRGVRLPLPFVSARMR